MRHMSTAISLDIYNKLKHKKYTDLYEEVCKILPPQYSCGYGIYDVKLKETDGCHYIDYEIGDSCD